MSSNATLSPDEDLPVEQLSPTVQRQWLLGQRIVTYTILDAETETVEAWFHGTQEGAKVWKPGQTALVLYDFSSPKVRLTALLQQRASQLRVTGGQFTSCVAIIVPDNIVGHVIRMFVGFINHPKSQTRIFFRREDGLQWLRSYLKD